MSDYNRYQHYNTSGCDWICSCSNVNSSKSNNASCNRCGKKKSLNNEQPDNTTTSRRHIGASQIGKNIAEKSHGLFSADDWQCRKCANVNWARRSTCNMCNAPRFSEIEQRTGYGGGFNEREKVEYKERNDDDDEYDEFGRKKKKRRLSNKFEEEKLMEQSKKLKPNSPKSSPKESLLSKAKESIEKSYDEEEDDEEENADLSKYDLWGSDEDSTNK